MTSDLSKSFFVGSRGNLANYVLPFQVPKPPKKMLKGEKKGGTPLVIFVPAKITIPLVTSHRHGPLYLRIRIRRSL